MTVEISFTSLDDQPMWCDECQSHHTVEFGNKFHHRWLDRAAERLAKHIDEEILKTLGQ